MGQASRVIHYDFTKKQKKDVAKKRNRAKGEGLVRSAKLEEVDSLRQKLSTATTEVDLRSRVVLEFLCRFGMRASELVLLKKTDFVTDADGNHLLRYYRPKRKDWHSVRISEQVKDELLGMVDAYHNAGNVEKARKTDHILFSVKHPLTKIRTELTARSLQRIVNAFGLYDGKGKLLAPHGLRHYVGIRAVKEKDHVYGAKLLGNSERVFGEYYSDPSVEALS